MSIFHNRSLAKGIVIAAILLVLAVITILFASANGIPVLNYHQINDKDQNSMTVSTGEFEAQMRYLAENGYTTISPRQLTAHLEEGVPLPENPVLITFDDGYKDNYLNAFPILQKYGQTATIFLISDYVGRYEKYLTWPEALAMQAGGINFESHTLSHMTLTDAKSKQELADQLKKSREAIEYQLGKNVEYIAYPCGMYSQQIIDATRAAGYKGAFTVNYGRSKAGDSLYALDRIPVFGCTSHSFLRFRLRLRLTHIFAPLQSLRADLLHNNYPLLARLIWIP